MSLWFVGMYLEVDVVLIFGGFLFCPIHWLSPMLIISWVFGRVDSGVLICGWWLSSVSCVVYGLKVIKTYMS